VDVLIAERITAGGRRGSSGPLVAETRAGVRIVKLRGAAQGTAPLVAEIIVAELAEAIGLAVPPRSLIELPAGIETADWDDELADLIAASVGLNLGFDFLEGAREFAPAKAVPESFLLPLVDASSAEPTEVASRIARRRAAYGAFLWKRLQPPRQFLVARALPVESRPQRPPWLRGR
jgi:hypothetical protein